MADKGVEEKTGTISLIDGKQNYKRRPQTTQRKQSCSASRLWIFFTVFFFLTTILAIAAFVWRYSFYEENRSSSNVTSVDILRRYAGFFRTRFQQRAFYQQVILLEQKEMEPVNTTRVTNETCTLRCTPRPQINPTPSSTIPPKSSATGFPAFLSLQATLSNLHYHACCISETFFISPDELQGIDNQPRVIAHFDDEDQRQYFQSQKCSQAEGCYGCQCTQIIDTHTALTVDPSKDDDDEDKYIIELVKVPGCCKCLNT